MSAPKTSEVGTRLYAAARVLAQLARSGGASEAEISGALIAAAATETGEAFGRNDDTILKMANAAVQSMGEIMAADSSQERPS